MSRRSPQVGDRAHVENLSFRAIADRLEFEWAHELTGDRYRWT